MNTSIRILSFVGILLAFIPHASCQTTTDEDLNQYFSDGGVSKRKTIIGTDFLAPITGAFAIQIERGFTKDLALEIGVLKLAPFYLFELIFPLNDYVDNFEPLGGWGFSISPRFYFARIAPEFNYMGLKFQWKRHTIAGAATIAVKDLTYVYGANFYVGKRLTIRTNFGFGIRHIVRSPSAGTQPRDPYHHEGRKFATVTGAWSLGLGIRI